MATASEKAELARLSSGSSPLVRVIQVPKLADALAPLIPRAGEAIREWDDRVEVWRKSFFFDFNRGANVTVAVPQAAAAPANNTTIITNTMRQIYTGPSPPVAPDDPTSAALFYPDGGGSMLQWSVPDRAWL